MTSSPLCPPTRSVLGPRPTVSGLWPWSAAASVPLGIAIGLLFWWGLGWPAGIVAFVVGTVVVAAVMWWAAEPLARRALGGTPADPRRHARLLNLVDALCATVGISHPDVRVRDEPGLNAAVCGRSRRTATLVVTQGLLDELNRGRARGCGGTAADPHPLSGHVAGDGDSGHSGHRGDISLSPRAGDGHGPGRRQLYPVPARAYRRPRENGDQSTEVRGASRATAQLWFADPGVGRRQ